MTIPDSLACDFCRREALSEPGEWYLDRKTGVLTYIAKPGEDPNRDTVIAPRATRSDVKAPIAVATPLAVDRRQRGKWRPRKSGYAR